VYDGNVVIQERDLNNWPATTYTRGKDLSGSLEGAGGIGGLLSMTLNGATGPLSSNSMYYHSDGNGNLTALIAPSQTIAAKYVYDAFGNVISKSGQYADANLYRFSSKEAHPPSGLVYYLYRYYDPNLQRWVNRDPIGEPGFETDRTHKAFATVSAYPRSAEVLEGADLYTVVDNKTVNRIDFFGLSGTTAAPIYPGYNPSANCPCPKGQTFGVDWDCVASTWNTLNGGNWGATGEGAVGVGGGIWGVSGAAGAGTAGGVSGVIGIWGSSTWLGAVIGCTGCH